MDKREKREERGKRWIPSKMKPAAASFFHLDTIQWNVCYWWPPCQIMTFLFPSYCTSLFIPFLVTQLSVRENERQWVGKGVMNKETETVEREWRESEPSGTHQKRSWNQWLLLNGFDLSLSLSHQRVTWLKPCHYCISRPLFLPQLILSLSPFSSGLYCFRLDPLSSLSSLCWLLTFLIITMI